MQTKANFDKTKSITNEMCMSLSAFIQEQMQFRGKISKE